MNAHCVNLYLLWHAHIYPLYWLVHTYFTVYIYKQGKKPIIFFGKTKKPTIILSAVNREVSLMRSDIVGKFYIFWKGSAFSKLHRKIKE